MKFFRTLPREEPAMPDAADPKAIDEGAHAQKLTPPGDRPAEVTDTGTRLSRQLEAEDDRPTCQHCRGTGRQLRTADYLGELVGMLPTDATQLDVVIAQFYELLLTVAPHLTEFFPPDLTTGDALNSHGNKQRDQLLNALVTILTRYDPDHPNSDAMQSLMSNADTWGRSHSEWVTRGGDYYVPSEEDYITVRNTLAQVLQNGLGDKLRPEHVRSLVAAYRSVSLRMQTAADQWRMQRGAPVVARRARPAVPQSA
jgi:hypothetical protein